MNPRYLRDAQITADNLISNVRQIIKWANSLNIGSLIADVAKLKTRIQELINAIAQIDIADIEQMLDADVYVGIQPEHYPSQVQLNCTKRNLKTGAETQDSKVINAATEINAGAQSAENYSMTIQTKADVDALKSLDWLVIWHDPIETEADALAAWNEVTDNAPPRDGIGVMDSTDGQLWKYGKTALGVHSWTVTGTGNVPSSTIVKLEGSNATLSYTRYDGGTGTIVINNVQSAARATADGNGNTITTTYATKTELANKQNVITNTGASNLLTAPAIVGGPPGVKAISDFRVKAMNNRAWIANNGAGLYYKQCSFTSNTAQYSGTSYTWNYYYGYNEYQPTRMGRLAIHLRVNDTAGTAILQESRNTSLTNGYSGHTFYLVRTGNASFELWVRLTDAYYSLSLQEEFASRTVSYFNSEPGVNTAASITALNAMPPSSFADSDITVINRGGVPGLTYANGVLTIG